MYFCSFPGYFTVENGFLQYKRNITFPDNGNDTGNKGQYKQQYPTFFQTFPQKAKAYLEFHIKFLSFADIRPLVLLLKNKYTTISISYDKIIVK